LAFTAGFDPLRLAAHFQAHRADFGAATAAAYEALADRFLGGPIDTRTHQCVRSNGDVLRYSELTQEFGIISARGVIRTYFKPKPRRHRYVTNLTYFRVECLK